MILPDLTPALGGYRLSLPRVVRFGWGVRRELGEVAAALGRRAWLVVGSRTLLERGEVAALESLLAVRGLQTELLAVITREPPVEDVDAATRHLLEHGGSRPGDVVIAVGGGSAIDLAKAVSAMVTNSGGASVQDYLEGVGRGLQIERAPLPMIALPTTSGTGSEVTRNAVISSLTPPFKKSLRSEQMVPAAVLLDPELTVSCPPSVTAHSGMDAITQLIESHLSNRANAFTSALCREGLQRALPALPAAYANGHDRAAREAMMHAAFLSGVALANSGLGLAHGVAAALGVQCGVPHGLACAVLLPAALRFNRDARPREIAEIGRWFSGNAGVQDHDAIEAAIAGVEALNRQFGIPARLSDLGVAASQLAELAAGSRGNSLSGNPREPKDGELHQLLESCL